MAIKVIIRDVLGIYSLKKTISNDSSLLVYPKPIELNNLSGVLNKYKNILESRLRISIGRIRYYYSKYIK